MTLRRLLDHLKLVASYQEVNKMTCQNLAVCFGPVLLSQRQEASCHTNRVFIDSEELASALHFKKHIEVLHYLLQLWPGEEVSRAGSFELISALFELQKVFWFETFIYSRITLVCRTLKGLKLEVIRCPSKSRSDWLQQPSADPQEASTSSPHT